MLGKNYNKLQFCLFSGVTRCQLRQKNWRIVQTNPFGATKSMMEAHHLPSRVFSAPKTPGIKDKNHFLSKRYTQATYLSAWTVTPSHSSLS
uniref:Uncharacterized protein n=1 Tax=Kuenenia stuttgartiensis TaxID=174633 RepID=Q1Q6W4_KUEST|nr:unknown protein [Candidatus Kuenenia stuttgartiensis]